ncbi:hypothetical protein BHM03_00009635, partial [Ensete ventricosum]
VRSYRNATHLYEERVVNLIVACLASLYIYLMLTLLLLENYIDVNINGGGHPYSLVLLPSHSLGSNAVESLNPSPILLHLRSPLLTPSLGPLPLETLHHAQEALCCLPRLVHDHTCPLL